jgi:hypothetical protein
MAKIQIDEGDLLMAFESGDGMMEWFLDRETGTVIGLGDDVLLDDEDDEDDEDWEREEKALRRAIHENVDGEEGGRYLAIESLGSHEGFRIMEDFASSLEEGRVREALFRALDRHRPFRSFQDALLGFPDVREAWFRYHEGRLREHALDWLRAEGIDAELTTPSPPD